MRSGKHKDAVICKVIDAALQGNCRISIYQGAIRNYVEIDHKRIFVWTPREARKQSLDDFRGRITPEEAISIIDRNWRYRARWWHRRFEK